MNPGKNFDDKAQWFQQRIYGDIKGRLRLDALWQDIGEHIPPLLNEKELSVWDAGGGLGQMSLRCAELGHQVELNDLSQEMLSQAKTRFGEREGVAERVSISCQSMQDFDRTTKKQFDVVICHAVLEWVDDAKSVTQLLCNKLKPGGYLSLAFYNVNATIFMNVLKGNFNKALSDDLSGHPGSLTPPNPQKPDAVLKWVEETGMEVLAKKPVRVAYDYLRRDLRNQRSEEDIKAVEDFLRLQPEFWAMGRYVHLIARKDS